MILSMTGHGDACSQTGDVRVAVEIRSVNSRYLKINVRGLDSPSIEAKIENLIRKHIRRGTVHVTIRFVRETTTDDYRINMQAVAAWKKQLEALGGDVTIDLATLLTIPGIVTIPSESERERVTQQDWNAYLAETVTQAIQSLQAMRTSEGQAMRSDFAANCEHLKQRLEKIAQRAPDLVENYQNRLTDRINQLLKNSDVSISGTDVAREVGVFAERSDISEEVVRLNSHLKQFAAISDEKESSGRKLDFLIQEMLRETNTIGSKSSDSEIAMHVVEIKTHIERMREMIQNVE